MTRAWTNPQDIRARVERQWARGLLLVPSPGTEAFPWRIPLRLPTTQQIAECFEEVRTWIRALQEASRPTGGAGFELTWETVRHRQLGSNAIPVAAIIPTLDDALALLQRRVDAQCFSQQLELTGSLCPALLPWIQQRPLVALACGDRWSALLRVVAYFLAHPRPGIFLRQIDLPGIDTKFIESQSSLIATLLDSALPAEHIDRSVPASRSFERRYGLQAKPTVLRLRLLDPQLAIAGLTDLAAPVEQLGRLALHPTQAIITENEINGLCLPERAGTIAIFGLGYAVELLAALPWLARTAIAYWGDIDTHGFAMLERLRRTFPRARSLLMDSETLLAHRSLWVSEPSQHTAALERLTPAEDALYQELLTGRWARNLRLEQERIAYPCVLSGLRSIGQETQERPSPPAAAACEAD